MSWERFKDLLLKCPHHGNQGYPFQQGYPSDQGYAKYYDEEANALNFNGRQSVG